MKSLLSKLFGDRKSTRNSTLKANRFRPCLEGLEQRALMAGDVTAALNAYGDLVITGDELDNSVSLTQLVDDTWLLSGNQSDGSLTVINGQIQYNLAKQMVSREYFPNFSGNIIFRMNGGDDFVEVYGSETEAARDVQVEMGLGKDEVKIRDIDVRDDLRVYTEGSGWDKVTISNVKVGGFGVDSNNNDLEVTTGSYNDWIFVTDADVADDVRIWSSHNLDHIYLTNVDAGDYLLVDAGNGHDVVSIKGRYNDTAIVGGDMKVELGSGNNDLVMEYVHVYEDLHIFAADYGNGADELKLKYVDVGGVGVGANNNDLEINLGVGVDEVVLEEVTVRDDLRIWIDSGTIDLDGIVVGIYYNQSGDANADLEITTGSGADTITIADAFIRDDLRLTTGAGNDTINLYNVNIGDWLDIDMGSGWNDTVNSNYLWFGRLVISGVENEDI